MLLHGWTVPAATGLCAMPGCRIPVPDLVGFDAVLSRHVPGSVLAGLRCDPVSRGQVADSGIAGLRPVACGWCFETPCLFCHRPYEGGDDLSAERHAVPVPAGRAAYREGPMRAGMIEESS